MSDRIVPFPASQSRYDSERRNEPRGRCLIEGRAVYSAHSRTRDVTIRNLGPHGAMIEGEALFELPERFTLAFTARGFARPATVAWRDSTRVGVALGAVGAA